MTGKLAIVTGATGGLGFEAALALAHGCADVVLAGRDESKGRAAAASIRSLAPRALVRFERLDVASLSSIAQFSERLRTLGHPVDVLVNNAGVMALPKRAITADGFEMQLGTNFLGHFALTANLLPLLRMSKSPRVVQVSSLAHRAGKINFDDLQSVRSYSPWAAYCQSKLANLLFALELQRRSDAHGWGLISRAAHPGFARTDLIANGPGSGSLLGWLSRMAGNGLSQSASEGALPIVLAATFPGARGGEYFGPGGMFELAGLPAVAQRAPRAEDLDVAARLWQVSEQLTRVEWEAEPNPALSSPALSLNQ